MKYLIIILGLGLCSSYLWQSPPAPTEETGISSTQLLVRQTQKSEDEVLCQPLDGVHQVFHIKHRWLINEYRDGHTESSEFLDTVWVQNLPFGKPCPGTLAEVSIR